MVMGVARHVVFHLEIFHYGAKGTWNIYNTTNTWVFFCVNKLLYSFGLLVEIDPVHIPKNKE